jgi:hypothetical protein
MDPWDQCYHTSRDTWYIRSYLIRFGAEKVLIDCVRNLPNKWSKRLVTKCWVQSRPNDQTINDLLLCGGDLAHQCIPVMSGSFNSLQWDGESPEIWQVQTVVLVRQALTQVNLAQTLPRAIHRFSSNNFGNTAGKCFYENIKSQKHPYHS